MTLELLGYPEYSVGRLMTPDYIAIRETLDRAAGPRLHSAATAGSPKR